MYLFLINYVLNLILLCFSYLKDLQVCLVPIIITFAKKQRSPDSKNDNSACSYNNLSNVNRLRSTNERRSDVRECLFNIDLNDSINKVNNKNLVETVKSFNLLFWNVCSMESRREEVIKYQNRYDIQLFALIETM